MFIQNYYSQQGKKISFSRQQASDFAKNIADDFNPIHDPDNKRFCVPGDLLFSLVLSQHGINQQMQFEFSGMVNDKNEVHFVAAENGLLSVEDDEKKQFITVQRSGNTCSDKPFIEKLIRQYVAFSGHTFPHILVKLMQEQNVMINPQRPMVMYQSMSLQMDEFVEGEPVLELNKATLDVEGKRGKVNLAFNILVDGNKTGSGEKHMLMSGLREYNQEDIDQLVTYYSQRKLDYAAKNQF